jgi:CubicO group peptidase (beta-lactamase class C family)
MKASAFTLLASLFLAAPTAEATTTTAPPDAAWVRSSPAEQGLDPRRLLTLTDLIREGKEYPDIHSLLIVRNGRLVLEEYFHGYSEGYLHMQQSVSKSFTSALIGIAIDQGKIEGVEEKVLGFFPGIGGVKNLDDRKRSITLQDLLTMRSGTDYHEEGSDSPHHRLNRLQEGWDRFYLDRPMLRDPGSSFLYDSGGVILMSSILERRTGMHADAYAAKHLFPALGVDKTRWYRNREGHPHTGGGLQLRPGDMARFGQMYLDGGRWKGRQVVPETWVKESTRRHVKFGSGSRGRVVGYGYLWWILQGDPAGSGDLDIYAAMGFRAQYIFVIPEHDMVVVVTGGTTNSRDQRRPVEFLYTHILPAVKR